MPGWPRARRPALKTCPNCAGSGRLPRQLRRVADGTPDPLDILGRHAGLCDRCGGSGAVPADPPPRTWDKKGSHVADIF